MWFKARKVLHILKENNVNNASTVQTIYNLRLNIELLRWKEGVICNKCCLDISRHGCIITWTHGLPCAHKLVQLKQENRLILLPLTCPFWRKLNDAVNEIVDSPLAPNPEISTFLCKFYHSAEKQQLKMLKVIKDVCMVLNFFYYLLFLNQ